MNDDERYDDSWRRGPWGTQRIVTRTTSGRIIISRIHWPIAHAATVEVARSGVKLWRAVA